MFATGSFAGCKGKSCDHFFKTTTYIEASLGGLLVTMAGQTICQFLCSGLVLWSIVALYLIWISLNCHSGENTFHTGPHKLHIFTFSPDLSYFDQSDGMMPVGVFWSCYQNIWFRNNDLKSFSQEFYCCCLLAIQGLVLDYFFNTDLSSAHTWQMVCTMYT